MFKSLFIHKSRFQRLCLVLLLAFITLQFPVFGQTSHSQRQRLSQLDTANLKKSDFKVSRGAYLDYYGYNDTARAIINMYFTKRKGTKIIAYSNLGFLTLIRVAGQEETSPLDPNADVKYKPWVVPAVVAAGSVAIFSLIRADAWSLRSLVKTIYTYERSGVLPVRLQRKLKTTHFNTK
jgi:hypothetical protein